MNSPDGKAKSLLEEAAAVNISLLGRCQQEALPLRTSSRGIGVNQLPAVRVVAPSVDEPRPVPRGTNQNHGAGECTVRQWNLREA